MGVTAALDFATDPFGKRYKKRSMNERLGITRFKRKLNTKFVRPFNKLNPMWHLRNLKRRVKRRLGYYSELGVAIRKREGGRYLKRKILASDRSGVIMPFRESQFTPYDLQSNPFDKEQTGPTRKGMFRKLSKYAAPGVVVGLAAVASRKHKLFKKLADKMVSLRGGGAKAPSDRMKRIKQTGAKLWAKAREHGHKAKAAVKHTAEEVGGSAKILTGTAIDHVKRYALRRYDKFKNAWLPKFSINPKGKKRAGFARRNKKRNRESAPGVVMPFRESYDYHVRQHEYRRPRSSFASKILKAGVAGATLFGGYKVAKFLGNTKRLAIGTEKAFQHMGSLKRLRRRSSHGIAPIIDAKIAYAQAKHGLYANALGVSGTFQGTKALKDANRAAHIVKLRHTVRRIKKFKGSKGVMPRKLGRKGMRIASRSVRRHEPIKRTAKRVNNYYTAVRARREAKGWVHVNTKGPEERKPKQHTFAGMS